MSDSDLVGMQCHDSRISDPEKADFLKIYSDTNGYVCRPPESEKLLMIYCKTPGH